jgi:hypothetical protein
MSDAVEVRTKVSFKPWPVPTEAGIDLGPGLKQDGIKPLPTIPLAELGDEVVDALVLRWLDNLYANRGQASPFIKRAMDRAA